MPDIQTEMQKILQAWEQPETTETTKETTVFKPTNNVTKSTFESVRDNPGLPKKEYIRKLEALGFKKASTSSLLSQMVRQGQIWVGSDGAMRPNAKEYTPIKSSKTIAKREAKAKKPKSYKVITFGQHYYDFTLRYNVTKHPRFVTKPRNVVFLQIAPQK